MPNPLYLKIMKTTLSEYNTLSSDEKSDFEQEARQQIAVLSSNPSAYMDLTDNTPIPESSIPEFKRKKKSKGDN